MTGFEINPTTTALLTSAKNSSVSHKYSQKSRFFTFDGCQRCGSGPIFFSNYGHSMLRTLKIPHVKK